MNIKRDLELLYELGCFRFVSRVWVQLLHPNFQNNTEHTFRVIWIALILAKYENVKNLDKVIKMALIHDIPESRTGDVHYISRQYTKRNEDLAVSDILKGTALEEFAQLWKEYEARTSIEAKIVKDADNLDVDLELQEQAYKGVTLKAAYNKLRKRAVSMSLYTKSAKKFWDAIQKSNPHDWHLNARNRFNDGDWKPVKKAK